MGCIRKLKCSKCGNVWDHVEGVGFARKPQKGSKENNTTGDADEIMRCPKCNSEKYEQYGEDTVWRKGVTARDFLIDCGRFLRMRQRFLAFSKFK